VLAKKDSGGTLDNLPASSPQQHHSKDNYIEISAHKPGSTPDLRSSVHHTQDKEKSVAYYYHPLFKQVNTIDPLNFLPETAASPNFNLPTPILQARRRILFNLFTQP
jgi:hypothetical protein